MSGPPEKPKSPSSAIGARQGRISGRVFLVLAISLALAVIGMGIAYLYFLL
jgi:hypothetical protein